MRTETVKSDLVQWHKAEYWDKPWNPWVGCFPVSPACDNCYARVAMEDRFSKSFLPHRTKKVHPPTKGVVFCGNMTDLFGDWIVEAEMTGMIADAALKKASDVYYIWCTKRVPAMKVCLEYFGGHLRDPSRWFSNSCFGFTAENQQMFDSRFKCANAFPEWANVWVSAEPLLGPINLGMPDHLVGGGTRIKWVAVGCESGKNRRPCRMEWIEDVVQQCRDAGVPCFVKQLDIDGKCERDISKFPEHLRIRQVPWHKGGKT